MPHALRLPNELRSFTGRGGVAVEDVLRSDRRDGGDGVRSESRGDVAPDLANPGWFGDLRQNLTNHWMVEQR